MTMDGSFTSLGPWLYPPHLHSHITIAGTAVFQVPCSAAVETFVCEDCLEESQWVKALLCTSQHPLRFTSFSLASHSMISEQEPHQHTQVQVRLPSSRDLFLCW